MSRFVLGTLFLITGVLHFLKPRSYEAVMPPWIPYHEQAVLISGVAELIGGAAMFSPRTHGFARWWLCALLVAVFPANIYMAINPEDIKGLDVPTWALWLRLPLQPLLIWWIWRTTRGPGADGVGTGMTADS